ncbi:MAG TPA: energy-coupling factor transporter ATPase [Desulfitobacteriaceae bacterium]|nr:energy-coupling factor transporter ATPase [Desulfitobacteriaceae bacterium]
MAFLQIENLSFSYPDAAGQALDNVSLEIEEGEMVVLCGVSGCGKSTLLRHLKREVAPHGRKRGVIYYAGNLLENLPPRTSAAEIGFVMQNPETQIVTDLVWHELAFGLENLGLSNPEIRRKVAEMASFFGIDAWFRKPVAELSGGQKQILNLAAVMAMQPRVLLLDEPTAQLDPIAAQELIGIITKINRDLAVTVILAEHRLEEAFPRADQVVVMDKGRVIWAGEPAKIDLMLEQEAGHAISKGLPSPIRIYSGIQRGNCPLTVREGRSWLNELLASAGRDLAGEPVRGLNREGAKQQKLSKLKANQDKAAVPGRPAAVELKQVWFKYEREGQDILRGVSLQAYPGQVLGILGGNGTGKTTMLGVMAGLLKPYRGQVAIAGRKITEFKSGELYRNNLVLLPQNPKALFVHDTVREELEEAVNLQKPGQEAAAREIENITAELDIRDLLSRHPYDLSGGEQQKAALAKLLLLKPKVVLLDEPTKGLDASSKEGLAKILSDLRRKGVTVVLVTHDLEFAAEYADACAMMFDGDIVSSGTAGEFFAGNSFYTTAANRMARGLFPQAVTCKDVIELCRINLPAPVQRQA